MIISKDYTKTKRLPHVDNIENLLEENKTRIIAANLLMLQRKMFPEGVHESYFIEVEGSYREPFKIIISAENLQKISLHTKDLKKFGWY